MNVDAKTGHGRVADGIKGHWVERYLPEPARAYARLARLERPIGWWLLLLPCWWSVALAQVHLGGGVPDIKLIVLFMIGAIVMRGAGCVLNDIVDRDFDAQVARTRSRPIPSGQVSVARAALFGLALALCGFAVLVQFNGFAIALGVASLTVVTVYPFAKRYTYWPQAVLGLAFNWGALLGWAAVTGEVSVAALALYAGGIAWTLAYDTIYAHQDKEDDVLIGVKSTALKFADATPRWLILFFSLAMGLIALAGWLAGAGWPFFIAVALAGAHAVWQLTHLDIYDGERCLNIFRANKWFGILIFAGAVAASLMAVRA